MNDMQIGQYEWVDTSEKLVELCSLWMQCDSVAIDTEFERTSTYFAKAGLIQVASDNTLALIDPLADVDLSLLAPLLESESITKIIHAQSEDVDLLKHHCGAWCKKIFDTQIAAALCGARFGMGYQAVVLEFLNVELDKSETRSDWLARPLSESQLSYAALDTQYLLKLFHVMKPRLEKMNRLAAVYEESDRLVSESEHSFENPEDGYLKLKGAWSLSTQDQQMLKRLVCWRDQTAISDDRPKSWVVSDNQLIDLVESKVANRYQFSQLKGMKPSQVKRYAEPVLDLLGETRPQEESTSFSRIVPPIKGESLRAYKSLKKDVQAIAQEVGVEAQLLAPKRLLEQLIYENRQEVPNAFKGWRRACLGDAFMDKALDTPSPLDANWSDYE